MSRRSLSIIATALASFTQSYTPLSLRPSSSILLHDVPVLEETQDDLLSSVKDILQINDADFKESQKAIINRITRQMQDNFDASSLAEEVKRSSSSMTDDNYQPPDFEWIRTKNDNNEQYPLAVRSLQPLINDANVSELRKEAESAWCTGHSSRFTYQRPGNYEVHVTDLSLKAKEIVNDCLRRKIYPWIQNVFGPYRETLHVYDALIIRYNATEAARSGAALGAGQPLHRDLGLVSINIKLNEDFVGGGTFFENQLRDSSVMDDEHDCLWPLKPIGVGHALAHYASERHAGSATLRGVRDILVIFVSANEPSVKSAMLKQCRSICETENANDAGGGAMCRIRHQLAAVKITPQDGEAWHYLGSSLMELSSVSSYQASPQRLLEFALKCFLTAVLFTPCDSRIYNNMGLVYVRLASLALSNVVNDEYSQAAEQAYQKGWELLRKSETAGCDVTNDFDALTLNYGLHLSNQDRFAEACSILDRLASKAEEGSDNRIIRDAHMLFSFCQQNIPRQ